MHVISDKDVQVFTDESGDTLSLLSKVPHGIFSEVDEIEQQEMLDSLQKMVKGLKDAEIDVKEAWKEVGKKTPEERAAAAEKVKNEAVEERSLNLRRLRLKAIARGMKIGTKIILDISEIMQTYDAMDRDSAAWVDAQVDSVWDGAVLSDSQREG